MKIDNFRKEVNGAKSSVIADVHWEDCDRSDYQIYFEINGQASEKLTISPHAFLLGGIIPALHFGEKRLQIEGDICSELIHGLYKVMQILNHWYRKPQGSLVLIEPKSQFCLEKKIPSRSAFFFSGGIDSYSILKENRDHYRQEHPRFFRDGILVFGLELDDKKRFNHVLEELKAAAKEVEINLVSISTNLYLVFRPEDEADHFRFWIDEFGGAGLAAVAHALSDLYTDVSIAGNCEPDLLAPWGTHPILDPGFSSHNLTIRHEGISTSRLAKTRSIANWKPALHHLRVCNRYREYRPGRLNCGKCEKCIRTMLELLAAKALEKTDAFPSKTISAEQVRRRVTIGNPFHEHFYSELIEPLKEIGREDLVKPIESKLKAYRRGDHGMKKKSKYRRLDWRINRAWKRIVRHQI